MLSDDEPEESREAPLDAQEARILELKKVALDAGIRIQELERAIRNHRDQRGDNRCWLDDRDLYGILPEGFIPPKEDTCVELERCKAYIASRHDPATKYVSPQEKIEELEKMRLFYLEREMIFIREWNLLSGALDKMFMGLKLTAAIMINSTNPYDFEERAKEFITLLETFHTEIKKASEKKTNGREETPEAP